MHFATLLCKEMLLYPSNVFIKSKKPFDLDHYEGFIKQNANILRLENMPEPWVSFGIIVLVIWGGAFLLCITLNYIYFRRSHAHRE